MTDRVLELLDEIADLECALEEANECGDLEDRLSLAQELEDKRAEHLRLTLIETGGT